MALNQIPFKTSRGVAAYISANAPSGLDPANVFPHKSAGYRTFPNVTVLVTHFNEQPDNPGCFDLGIIISVRTVCIMPAAPSGSTPNPAYVSEALVGAIADLFEENMAGTDRTGLADAITAAARAVGAAAAALSPAGNDADLQFFKVDRITPGQNATSSVEEKEGKAQCWVDDFPFELTVRAVEDVEPV